jgi:Leucine-rich repeat (LRR) protein
LADLNLSNNQIEVLSPHFFRNLTKLVRLDISFNKFKSYSKDFLLLKELKYLNLTGNFGYKLENFFKHLKLDILIFEWPTYVGHSLSLDNRSDIYQNKVDLVKLKQAMEENEYVTFEIYRKAVEGHNWINWDQDTVFLKAMEGIKK